MSRVDPVKKQILVEASQEHAFRVFTVGIHRWWPPQHHIGKSPLKRAVLEPRPNGRWYSVCEDDSECDLGKVLTWDPPRRLVLAWQITANWQFDPNFLTEVEVNFIAEGPKKTRVELEHRNLERFGIAAPSTRSAIDHPDGWSAILASFGRSAETEDDHVMPPMREP